MLTRKFDQLFQDCQGISSISGFEYAGRSLPDMPSVPHEFNTVPTTTGQADPAL